MTLSEPGKFAGKRVVSVVSGKRFSAGKSFDDRFEQTQIIPALHRKFQVPLELIAEYNLKHPSIPLPQPL